MKKVVIQSALTFALCSGVVVANETTTYTQNYSVTNANAAAHQNDNRFMQGNFENIYRFDFVLLDGDEVADSSSATWKKIIQKTQELEQSKKDFLLTLTAHTHQATDDKSENAIESQSYANKIQSAFREDFTTQEALRLSQRNAQTLKQKLLEEGVDKESLFVEYRGAKDSVMGEMSQSDKDASDGVFVAIYVVQKTPLIAQSKPSLVSKTEPSAPKEKPVIAVLDSDGDGVEDAKDECKRTPEGVSVDIHGCPLKSTLKLNFAVNSAEILQDSYGEVERFASFLKANPMYHAEITGHTDSRGKDVLNMLLSQKRAQSTKEALVKAGVEASRLSTKGRGELDPIASNMLEEGRKANRRIEVELFLKK